ncbi:Kazal-like serine protease inhibitor domain and phox-like domain-containing protein [Phytophthora cinnamomi]|uniref:Kazal-like serine protease inhibitor domain and phox-like domain-containing protein n=1 Tax=Phytophthora cinnamomi TaxID=4785 RepID=UPI003559D653|nr:Kazal-like serine protease inhibitor domain and phox-like domain-containing protein [Phytophthora cinnamomi]
MTSSESALRRLLTARRAEVATVSVAAKPATVFDSQDVTAPYTQYMFKLRSSGASKEEWRFRKRYSEFRALRRKLRRWRKRWEMSCAKQGEAFQAVAKLLKQAAGPDFPRKHIRCDTGAIIHERRRRFMDYVRTLLAVYTDLEVLLAAPGSLKGNFLSDVVCLNAVLTEIQRFLEIPPKRKEVEAKLTRAVMVLQDVVVMKTPAGEGVMPQCCICLGESDPTDNQGSGREMAQLACKHAFHEDCIIHWLQCGSTCPMCRRAVGHTASRRVAIL